MKIKKEILVDLLIDDVLRRWPQTVGCVIAFKMLCVGCPFGVFHSVSDICKEHGVQEDVFLDCLVAKIAMDKAD